MVRDIAMSRWGYILQSDDEVEYSHRVAEFTHQCSGDSEPESGLPPEAVGRILPDVDDTQLVHLGSHEPDED